MIQPGKPTERHFTFETM